MIDAVQSRQTQYGDWRVVLGSFIIESIGFSATHAMAAILRDQPNFHVTHGSRNFKEGGRIGVNNLSVTDFVSQMQDAEEANDHCVAIHCLYPPETVAQEAKKKGVVFYGLCRKDTRGQVLSGFFWALKKFLYGSPDMGQHAFAILQKHGNSLKNLNISPNYMSALMLYSLQRVVSFNLELAKNSEGIIFMEDFLTHPGEFLGLFDSQPSDDEKIDVPRTVSHRKQSSQHEFLIDYEETLDTLMAAVSFPFENNQIKCSDVRGLIAKKSVLNPRVA